MTQPTDVVIDGAGYMIANRTYARTQDGMAEGRTGRIAFTDFFGGQRRHLQLERDRAWDGLNVGPVMGGQGVQPWGQLATSVPWMTTHPLPDGDVRIPTCVQGNNVYFALGRYLYRTVGLNAGWAAPTMVYDAGFAITSLAPFSSRLILMSFGAAQTIRYYSVVTGNTFEYVEGEYAHAIAAYAGFAIWVDARTEGRPCYLRMGHGSGIDDRALDYDITHLTHVDGKLHALTTSAIYSFSGHVSEVLKPNPAYSGPGDTDPPSVPGHEWTGEWGPFFQHGVYGDPDDVKVYAGYGGRLHAWVSGRMMEHNPNGDRAGWRETGLAGKRCLGGTVAGGYVVVAIESWDGFAEVWAWDGSGWWRVGRKPAGASGNWCWPAALAGAGLRDVLLFREGEVGADLLRLQHRSATAHAFPAAAAAPAPAAAPTGSDATFVTPMIDAGERDKSKAWRKVGAVFAAPELTGATGSTDAVTVHLDYSIDAGATWVDAGSRSCAGNSLVTCNVTIDTDIASDAASSRFVMLRVRWTSVSNWAPVLVGIWTEFEVLDSPARRRRWTFAVHARDQTIDRDGSRIDRTGRQLVADLWHAWQEGTTLTFRDLDYGSGVGSGADADPAGRRVRIIGISEKVDTPSDQHRWGESMITLTMVEV